MFYRASPGVRGHRDFDAEPGAGEVNVSLRHAGRFQMYSAISETDEETTAAIRRLIDSAPPLSAEAIRRLVKLLAVDDTVTGGTGSRKEPKVREQRPDHLAAGG